MSRRTIQSPGVEIREIDLTQRAAAVVGTSVFIAGFSNQGPTDEVFNVGTFAEFQEIYGQPTNAAERYFYHSARQVFNSDANVFVSRLPYGSSSGVRKYSALVYPVVGAKTATISGLSGFGGTNKPLEGALQTDTDVSGITKDESVALELTVKDTNNNLSFISVSTVGGYGGDGAGANELNYYYLSAGANATMDTLSADLIGKTIVAGQLYSEQDNSTATSGFGASLSGSSYYVFGNPTLVNLSEAQFNAARDGNITWSDTASSTGATFDGDLSAAGAGLIVLNTGATVTNNNFEGYYVGISDGNQSNPATNFTSTQKIYTTTSTVDKVSTGFAEIPTSRLGFELTGNYDDPKSNVSKTLETFSKIDVDGPEFNDTLNIGVFKVRNTPFSNTELELTNFLAEGYTGSLDLRRKLQDELGGPQRSFFLEDQDNASPNVKILVNPNISDYSGAWTSTTGDAPTKSVRVLSDTIPAIGAQIGGSGLWADATNFDGVNYLGLYPLGIYHTTNNLDKNVGSIPSKLDRVFQIAENVDLFQIDVSVEAGLGTIHTFATNTTGPFTDTDYVDIGNATTGTGFYTADQNMTNVSGSVQTTYRDSYRTIFNRFEGFARSTRKDHIFIADALRPLVVQGVNGKALDDKTKNFSKHVYWPLRHQFGTANSNFATTYGNWAKVYDGSSGKQIWIPFSGVAAKIYADNDANFAPWYAPAGFNRGVVTGVNDIAVSPTQRQRDQLYRIAINPVTQFPAEGIVIFGQKTLQRKPTAFDRVNVRRLFLNLEKRTRQSLKFFIFEPNTFLTRNKVVNTLTPIFENCKQTEGVYDYLIVCDERNNPTSVIEQNELRVDIYLKPVRTAEFILVNFYAVNTEVNFEEIVGQ